MKRLEPTTVVITIWVVVVLLFGLGALWGYRWWHGDDHLMLHQLYLSPLLLR